ncbi:MAG: GTPase HflX [Candidatus Hodarchaeota archaeon]
MSLKLLKPAIVIYRHAPAEQDLSEELHSLVFSCGYRPIKTFKQIRPPSAKYNLGRGKIFEIKDELETLDEEIKTKMVIIFGNELTPTQKYNLEVEFGFEVIDKTYLILEIFEQRASSEEAKLQVSLARSKYSLAFLKADLLHKIGQRFGTERRGFRQLGESRLMIFETNYKRQEARIEQQIKKLEKTRNEQRKQQIRDIGVTHYTVSLVGYTSSGKSTLLNTIAGSQVPTSNQLFTTLSTTTRRVFFENTLFLVSDTVGFLDGLPTSLIEAFRSTLEASVQAHILVIVLDVSNPLSEIFRKLEVVLYTLDDIKATNRRVLALNKSDLVSREKIEKVTNELRIHFPNTFDEIFSISALKGNVKPLEAVLLGFLPKWKYKVCFSLYDPNYAKWRSFIYNTYHVEQEIQSSDGESSTIIFTARILINPELKCLENLKLVETISTDLSPMIIQESLES